jgi:hypothetical protein
MNMVSRFLFAACAAAALFSHSTLKADDNSCPPRMLSGATVYVPLYSHIYFGDSLKPFNLAATLSIRNSDVSSPIEIVQAKYHGSDGKFIRNFLDKPVAIPPLASYSIKVKESDIEGGSGASVIVIWKSRSSVSAPIIESVMIGAAHGQGISFTSRGKVVSEQDSMASGGK